MKVEEVKGPGNPFPEKVKLMNTHITCTYLPPILVHKSEAYDASFFFFSGPVTEEKQVCGVVAVFISSTNSTTIPCMNFPDYPFLFLGDCSCIFDFCLHRREAGVFCNCPPVFLLA